MQEHHVLHAGHVCRVQLTQVAVHDNVASGLLRMHSKVCVLCYMTICHWACFPMTLKP